MITDRQVFTDEYPPRQILHRDGEQEQLARALDPALDGDRADDVLIHGPQGVGKTVLTRHILRRLDRQAGIQWTTAQCLGETTAGIVRQVLRGLGADPAGNTPQEDLCLQLRERVVEPTVVVLDEADDVPDTDALSRLWDVPEISVVVICHNRDRWLSRLDDQPRRRWHDGIGIELDRYAPTELADILGPRAQKGLAPNAAGRDQLEEIADHCAGSARTAIQTLLGAATVASERQGDQIRPADIPEGYERAQRWIRQSHLASLGFHHHVLYELIRQAGEISGEELHQRYDEIAEAVYEGRTQTPLGRRARRYKLDKIEEYDLIDNETTYSVLDHAIRSDLKIGVPTRPQDSG
jgi:cell division control protein 6